ncbi:MAG TPA: DUF6691 family protein [Planctomycetota bacterium]|nr:DUF6691 family protein [Planctomycetota bacterium]
MKAAVAFACGIVFATGLGISGMLQPAKVIGFLDLFGNWDPTLLGVMGGAVAVHAVAWIWRRGRPSVWGSLVPAKASHVLDGRLVLGASLFGVGWGMVGVCPGPAVTNLAAATPFTLSVLAAMLAGVALSFLVPARASERGRAAGERARDAAAP